MPSDASETRQRLLDAATRAFAEHGVTNASLLDITRQAGQRNRGALHYHFGSREGVLCAILDRHSDFLARREGELLALALATPGEELEPVVEAVVRPAAELAESGWQGRCCLLIIAELAEMEQTALSPDVQAALGRTGGHVVYGVLAERLSGLSKEILVERFALVTAFIVRAVADRSRLLQHGAKSRPQLDYEAFVQNLVAMAAAALAAPVRALSERSSV